jgi:type III restriction enzyme
LLDDQLLDNLRAVQLRNGLRPDETLRSNDFTVEMETGTGKTYVYLRTIYELNRRYGFSKFVIVVPSVAIKEGVYKTLQITRDHFASLYGGVPCEFFLYDSGKLGQVRGFATSPNLQIMVVTVGAINKKDVNNLYKPQEKTGGEEPVRLIQATRPVVIVDEPQSVDGGLEGQGKQALGAMAPLCTLRYSATHVGQAPHGVPPRRRRRLRARTGEADRGGLARDRGRPQPALREARLDKQHGRQGEGEARGRRAAGQGSGPQGGSGRRELRSPGDHQA